MRALEILEPGSAALIQDLGRPGRAHLGVPPSGALDIPALRLANRLTGNPEPAAGIEALLGGLRVRARCSCTAAVTGPAVPVTVDGRAVGSYVPVHLSPDEVLEVGVPERGLRCYLAISGGVAVTPELGSRSTDVLSGIGPAALRAGDVLELGERTGLAAGSDELAPQHPPTDLLITAALGPHDDWFTDPARALGRRWTVTPESNRVGLRLDGEPLRRTRAHADAELPSAGILTGAIQIPPNGLPVVFLADHPTTGGYPIVGVVPDDALPALAQARPGTTLRLHP